MERNAFERAFKATIGHEGGFVDDPADSGGATRFGITERVARAHGYGDRMDALPIETARAIAREQYWHPLRLDDVAGESERIAAELFDTGYNAGIGTAGQMLQRALTVLNRGGLDYADLVVDGIVGPMTLAALRAFLDVRETDGEGVLLKALNCLQGARYIELAERRVSRERFLYGWLRTRVGL